MIRLALSDLDDTLIPYGQGRASNRSIAAIRRVNAIPGLVAGPISGRTIGMMSWMFEADAADCFSTGIFVNGQVVRLRGEVIRREAPSRNTLDALADYLKEVEGEGVALTLYDDEVEGREICVGTTTEQMARHPKAFHAFHLASEHVPEGLFVKTNIHCDRPRPHVERLRDDLTRRFPELSFVFPNPTSSTIDITPAGVTKMTGLQCLMDRMGIGLEEVCVFGDSENDMAIIEGVPNSVAVANATPQVAAAARWHIGPANQDAVAQALEDIADAAEKNALPSFMQQ
ncbi:MAG: Cof-type HAD-IIB family hydrolase [Olsenella sp.]|jgi:HAD superfamily hydrolase (TIGR01484 family)|nr:Cof-type HAD-IIB family hydrolase [Olsenella sp.]MCI1289008.1 Cof-type HAD-IIB family hydrolase [Olsenella sp.]